MLESILEELPEQVIAWLDEVPLIVEDEPDPNLLDELDQDGVRQGPFDLLGLHWGIALTERSVQHSGTLPDRIMIFRGPILRHVRSRRELRKQIRITVLHEIGHHFGLDEDDLRELGYG